MTHAIHHSLQRSDAAAIMQQCIAWACFALLCSAAPSVSAQERAASQDDDLDVTMQIITDPDAKRPDEVVRQIPLPPRKPAAPAAKNGLSAGAVPSRFSRNTTPL